MKLAYQNIDRVLSFEPGYVVEWVIEHKSLFWEVVNSITVQIEGMHGNAVLSVQDRPVEMSRYADITVQFAPFELNRKNLLTKLYAALEQRAVSAGHYVQANEILHSIDRFLCDLSEDLPFELDCKKMSIGPLFRAMGIVIEDSDKNAIEKVFEYMELVRELDKDRLFIMVNMRTYFSDSDMELFVKSACLHDFKVLLLESAAFKRLPDTKRYTIDQDLCEF